MLKRVPDAFVIVFALIVVAAILTWALPGGRYERRAETVNGHERQLVVPGSFRVEPSKPQVLEIFTAPIRGFLRLGEIIVFIFLVGGAFFILNETGAVAAGTQRLVRRLKGREILVIPIVMTLFSFLGAAFGMCEEAMPFVLIFVPMSLALGYDSIVGASMSFLAAGVGFAGAFLNPFTLQIAQGISGLKPVSGWEYRLVVWAAATALAVACLLVLAATVVMMVLGVIALDWYITELGGLFFAMGVAAGILGGMGPNRLARAFIAGVKDMAGAALIVGFAGGILVTLESGNVMDTILYGMARVTAKLPPMLSADAMFFIQTGINFFIPSGSTKAALTMPLMAPLADLSGITRQTAVLAYQLGDGFTNMIIPTSGVTIGTLAMARIPYAKWARWNLPMQIAFVFLSLALLVWPVLSGWE